MLTEYKKYGIGFSEAPYVFFFTKGSCWKYLILLNKSKRNYQKFHAFEKIDGEWKEIYFTQRKDLLK